MKKTIISGVITIAVVLLSSQFVQAQGTMTYLSNVDQTSVGSLAVGSDSWVAELFKTGTNASGYLLDSIQLGLTDATGTPSGFTVMIYSSIGGTMGPDPVPANNLGTLNDSLNPVSGGIFTYIPTSNLTLLPSTQYFIVLTAGTTVADGAYDWSYVGANSYNPSDAWSIHGGVVSSSNGSSWPHVFSLNYPQFAITATPIPEPGVLALSGLGGLLILWHRRKSRAVL
jgi:hypothetical protein